MVELSFTGRSEYLPKLVEVLIELKRHQDASYIATKHKLSEYSDLYHEKYTSRENELQKKDRFEAAENFYTDTKKKYLSLEIYGIGEKDVEFITRENVKR